MGLLGAELGCPVGFVGFDVGCRVGWAVGEWVGCPAGIAVGMRRLHDTNRAGWWLLLNLVPIAGQIVLTIWMFERGTPGTNRFGADPAPETHAGGAASDANTLAPV